MELENQEGINSNREYCLKYKLLLRKYNPGKRHARTNGKMSSMVL
jgi:hypothetical protein